MTKWWLLAKLLMMKSRNDDRYACFAYLNYPLLGDMYAYNTIETGFAALRKQCNALDELLTREDIGEVLLNRYENIKLYDLHSSNRVSYNEFIAPSALEILAAQPEIINNTDDETFTAINDAIYKKCSAKSDEVYSATKSLYYSVLNENRRTGDGSLFCGRAAFFCFSFAFCR